VIGETLTQQHARHMANIDRMETEERYVEYQLRKRDQKIADLQGQLQCLMTRLTTVETFLFDAGDRKAT
jgi:hypothetical protein